MKSIIPPQVDQPAVDLIAQAFTSIPQGGEQNTSLQAKLHAQLQQHLNKQSNVPSIKLTSEQEKLIAKVNAKINQANKERII